MEIITIVNIITSLAIILGGLCMKKYADSPADYSIGYRTQRAMASKEAWFFANNKCGSLWGIIGSVIFAAVIVSAIFIQPNISENAGNLLQPLLLILHITAVITSLAYTEKQLINKFDNNDKKS